MSEKEQKQEKLYRKMMEEPVGKLVCSMAVPTIISMLVTAFYNMVDTLFVGRIGTSATAAVGVVFSIMALMQAVGFFFGHGSGNYISIALGEQKMKEADRMAATGFFSAFAVGALIMGLGLLFLHPLVRGLGSTDTIAPYATDYLSVILVGAPVICASFTLNNQLRLQGNAIYAMVGIVSGAVVNIGLDPLLMFVFHMGIRGAAVATVISQGISFCLLLYGYQKKSLLKIRLRNFRFQKKYYAEIFKGGLPSLFRQGFMSIANVCLSYGAGQFGDAAVAAMSIVSRVTTLAASALIGFGQGFQPVCGYNYGAKQYARVKQGFWFCVKVSTVALTVIAVVGFLFAPSLIGCFRKGDGEVLRIGVLALRAQCVTFPLNGWITMSNMMEQNIGKTWQATFLAVARQGLFFIPLILLTPHVMGLTGIWLTQAISDGLTVLCAIPIQRRVLREIPNRNIIENH